MTSGGRVLAVVGFGDSVEGAQTKAYDGVLKICFDDVQYRKDIGHKAIRYQGTVVIP